MPIRTLSKFYWRRYLRRNGCPVQDLDTFPRLSPPEQRRELARRLLAQIQYFGRREDALPEWREAAAIRSPDELWRLWPALPVVTKTMLETCFEPRQMQTRFNLSGRIDATGGSTGEPIRFFHDRAMLRAIVSVLYYSSLRMGWCPGMPILCVWGSERDIGKSVRFRVRLQNRLLRNYLLAGYKLSEATVDRFVELARRCRPVAVFGFTTMLVYLAERVLARGLRLPAGAIRTAWNGGEMLYPEDADCFQRAFRVPLLNRYGGRELSAMACQFEPGGPLWVMRPWLFLEIVDDRGRAVPPGEPGRLLWTSTICRGTPFLRYDVEDLGASDPALEDESGVRGIRQLCGRVAGLIDLPDGRKVNNLFWNHLFKEFPEVRQFQVIQRGTESFRILLKGAGFPAPREAEVRRILCDFLGPCDLALEWVEEIPRTPQGKLIQVVRGPA